MDHLSALQLRLSNERIRLSNAKTDAERELRKVWVAQMEREIQDECKFIADMSLDDLARELGA